MTDELAPITAIPEETVSAVMAAVVKGGDLSLLSEAERGDLLLALCTYLKLNPLTKPFDLLRLNNKLVLYANKSCTEQLSKLYRLSSQLVQVPVIAGEVIGATARVTDPSGRFAEATGVVPMPKSPADLANALMKAETKATRRATLRWGGLGILDESERDTIGAMPATDDAPDQEPSAAQRLMDGQAMGEHTPTDIGLEPDPEPPGANFPEPMAPAPEPIDVEPEPDKKNGPDPTAGFMSEQEVHEANAELDGDPKPPTHAKAKLHLITALGAWMRLRNGWQDGALSKARQDECWDVLKNETGLTRQTIEQADPAVLEKRAIHYENMRDELIESDAQDLAEEAG